MLKAFLLTFLASFLGIFALQSIPREPLPPLRTEHEGWWTIQSVDTMKYSRDLAREKLKSPSFDQTIEQQVASIASTGATYVAIATPYDTEFIPFLTRWVNAARRHNLHVWFRGNFSGWERWFGYPAISREEHTKKIGEFIAANPDLFEAGDIFTPCPECENGGPGDPRKTGDVAGHRLFLITEYEKAAQAFQTIGKAVSPGYFSMNYDVAKTIMDPETARALGGVVTIDHYVRTPEQLVDDIDNLARLTRGKIFLGEFGAPIPDIHGSMSDTAQAEWVSKALLLLAKDSNVYGINYWVGSGGSSAIWHDDGSPKLAVSSLTGAFIPKQASGSLRNQFNKPIMNAEIISAYKKTTSNQSGQFIIPVLLSEKTITIRSVNYPENTIQIDTLIKSKFIIMAKTKISLLERVQIIYNAIFRNAQ